MTIESNRNRLIFWDVAKGAAILLVIIGHIDGIPGFLREMIFSFHMPFFFIANAYFIRTYDVRKTFVRSVRSLLYPYMTVCMISAVWYTQLHLDTGEEPWRCFMQKVYAMILGISFSSTIFTDVDSVWLVWFVICLFVSRNLYVLVMHGLQRFSPVAQGAAIGLIALLGYYVGTHIAFLPWSADVAAVSLLFMWVGDFLSKKNIFSRWFLPLSGISAVVWLVTLKMGIQIELATRRYPRFPLCILQAIAGSIFFVAVFCWLEQKGCILPPLEWLGKNSMVILAVHCFEMMYVDWDTWFYSWIPYSGNFWVRCIIKIAVISMVGYAITAVRDGVRWLDRADERERAMITQENH